MPRQVPMFMNLFIYNGNKPLLILILILMYIVPVYMFQFSNTYYRVYMVQFSCT